MKKVKLLKRRVLAISMALAMILSSLVVPQGVITAYAEDDGQTLAGEDEQSSSDGDVTIDVEDGGTPSTDSIKAVEDTLSPYSPTQIKNGDFETTPWESYVLNGVTYTSKPTPYPSGTITAAIPNGVGEGWNTTEDKPYQGSLFEVWNKFDPPADQKRPFPDANGHYFIEMNANQPAALYQDLPTQGGDVIKWTLQHAARNSDGSDEQSMYVTIGAPEIGTKGEILAASGVDNRIDPKIQDNGKAIYSSGGVTAESKNASCTTPGSLKGLSVKKSETKWYDVAGIYVVPAGQDVTRFAFCAGAVGSSGGDSKKLSCGNFLDNITFSTLFGNLKATKQANGNVKISGYWGDSDPNKKLVVEFDEDKKDINMSGVCNSNFTIDIPQSVIGASTSVKVYHQDYDTAKTTVTVTHAHSWSYVSGTDSDTNKIYAYCSASGGSACSYQGAGNKVAMTLAAANATYNGTAYSGARVSSWSKSDDALAPKPEIKYYCLNGGKETETDELNGGAASLGAAPKNVGHYRAKIQIEIGEATATATADFSIDKLGINAVSFTEPTTASGRDVPHSLLGIADNAYYGGSISWDSSDRTFAYNRQYTATVTLGINNNNCEFATQSAINVPSGWTKTSVNNTSLTLEKKYKIKPDHITHTWTYKGQGNQLSAYCASGGAPGCAYDSAHKLTLTLSASDMTYTGSAYTGASISAEGQSAWTAAGLEIPTIKYEGDTGTDYSLSDTAPTAVGNYKAMISVGEEKAEAAFQITSGGSGSGGSGSGSGSGGSGSGSGSGGSGGAGGTQPTTPTENFDIPVKNENTVKVEAEIKDGTANVSEITNDTIGQVVNNKDEQSKVDTITIDLYGAKQEVTGVTLSKESVKTLAETTAQKDNGIDTATIELSKATVELDHKALETLAEQAKGTQIQLVVEDKDRRELNNAQQATLGQHQVATTFEAYFTSDGQRIHDFKGGKAVVSIDFTPETGKDASYYHLVYVAESGDMTRYKTKYQNRKLMFTTTHFSDYAVIYDTGERNETEKTEEEKEDNSSGTDGKVTMDKSYSRLRLRVPISTKTTNVLKWTKQTGADGYVIYSNHCNTGEKKYKIVQRVVIKDGSTTTWVDKNLDGGTYYKYCIKAYKLVNGKKVWLAKSKVVHSTTTGGKYGNAKTVKVNKTALSLTKGKTFTIKAEQVVKDLPIKKHTDIKYESSNTKVASVTGKGVIKAKKKGTCYIYVYAQNGMYRRMKVTVK